MPNLIEKGFSTPQQAEYWGGFWDPRLNLTIKPPKTGSPRAGVPRSNPYAIYFTPVISTSDIRQGVINYIQENFPGKTGTRPKEKIRAGKHDRHTWTTSKVSTALAFLELMQDHLQLQSELVKRMIDFLAYKKERVEMYGRGRIKDPQLQAGRLEKETELYNLFRQEKRNPTETTSYKVTNPRLSGLTDSMGKVSIHSKGNQDYRPVVAIGATEEVVPRAIQRKYHGSVMPSSEGEWFNTGEQTGHAWYGSEIVAVNLLQDAKAGLVLLKPQADLAIEFQERRKQQIETNALKYRANIEELDKSLLTL